MEISTALIYNLHMYTSLFSQLISMDGSNPESSLSGNAALADLIVRLMNDLVQARRDLATERELRESLEYQMGSTRQTTTSPVLPSYFISSPLNRDSFFMNPESPSNSAICQSSGYESTSPAANPPIGSLPSPLDHRTEATRQVTESDDSADDDTTPRLNLLQALHINSPSDEDKVITVRKVHKLGFRSQALLRRYFSKYGTVDDVVLLPMRARPKPGADGMTRGARPSSMGFVVMASTSAAQAALRIPLQEINGWPIEVRAFVRPSERPPMP